MGQLDWSHVQDTAQCLPDISVTTHHSRYVSQPPTITHNLHGTAGLLEHQDSQQLLVVLSDHCWLVWCSELVKKMDMQSNGASGSDMETHGEDQDRRRIDVAGRHLVSNAPVCGLSLIHI